MDCAIFLFTKFPSLDKSPGASMPTDIKLQAIYYPIVFIIVPPDHVQLYCFLHAFNFMLKTDGQDISLTNAILDNCWNCSFSESLHWDLFGGKVKGCFLMSSWIVVYRNLKWFIVFSLILALNVILLYTHISSHLKSLNRLTFDISMPCTLTMIKENLVHSLRHGRLVSRVLLSNPSNEY